MPEVILAASLGEVEEAVSLRHGLLACDSRQARAGDEYDWNPTTVHCLVRGPGGDCIGSGRLVAPVDTADGETLVEGNPIIGPIAVVESERGRGIGSAILVFLEEEALALYGCNGVVTVEAWVPEEMARNALVAGYTVTRGERTGEGVSARVFWNVASDPNGDSLRGPAVA